MAGRGFNLFRIFTNTIQNTVSTSRRGYKKSVRRVAYALKNNEKEYLANLTEEEKNELSRRSNFVEWNYSAEVFAFGKRLHEEFTPELLVQAFTHRSYIVKEETKLKEVGVESPDISIKDNDSLASEGEKIMSNYIVSYVSHFFPRLPLESIHYVKDYLMSEEVLANISKNLGTTFLILSADYPVESDTYSKTLKAIVGALNECQGIERARLFVRDFIVTQLAGKDINDLLNISNPLEVLSDILKRDGRAEPEPRLVCQSAVNTIFANYHVAIYSNKEFLGQCSGETIDTAIEMAAYDALKRLFHTTDSCSPISYDVKEVPEEISNLKLSEWNSAAFASKKV